MDREAYLSRTGNLLSIGGAIRELLDKKVQLLENPGVFVPRLRAYVMELAREWPGNPYNELVKLLSLPPNSLTSEKSRSIVSTILTTIYPSTEEYYSAVLVYELSQIASDIEKSKGERFRFLVDLLMDRIGYAKSERITREAMGIIELIEKNARDYIYSSRRHISDLSAVAAAAKKVETIAKKEIAELSGKKTMEPEYSVNVEAAAEASRAAITKAFQNAAAAQASRAALTKAFRNAAVTQEATAVAAAAHKRSVDIILLCSYGVVPQYSDNLNKPHEVNVLTRAAQLIDKIFKFESILQPLATEAVPAPTVFPTTFAEKQAYVKSTFCSTMLSLDGSPVKYCYAVVDSDQYSNGMVHSIIGACILAQTDTHFAIWSVVGDPYRVKAKTFKYMFNKIKIAAKNLGLPRIALIASDAPIPFVTFDDRIKLYAAEGLVALRPTPLLTGVSPEGVWGDIPVGSESLYKCLNLKVPGTRFLMTYTPGPDTPAELPLELPARVSVGVQLPEIIFSLGHSQYRTDASPSLNMIPVNTGNTRVVVLTVPSSAINMYESLFMQNVITELLKSVPFEMLIKLFPGINISPSTPLPLKTGSSVSQQISSEIYGGFLIKIPSYPHAIGFVTNFITIYVYDVNTNIPDMGITYADPTPEVQAMMGLYKVDLSRPFALNDITSIRIPHINIPKTKIVGRSAIYAPSGLGPVTPGTTATLGTMLAHLNTVPVAPGGPPRILLHALCGTVGDAVVDRTEIAVKIEQRLFEIYPRLPKLDTSNFIEFNRRFGNAVMDLAQQIGTVEAENGGATATKAGGGRTRSRARV